MSTTRICVTSTTLRKPLAIMGQIKMEESLGNEVYLYPRNSTKLLDSIALMPDTIFSDAMVVLSKVYGHWPRTPIDNNKYYQMVAANIQRIKGTNALESYLPVFSREAGEIDFLDEQAIYYASFTRSTTHYEIKKKYGMGLKTVMRTKDLQDKPAIIKAAMSEFSTDPYVFMEMIRKLRASSNSRRQFYQKWNALWAERLKVGHPFPGEIEAIIRELISDARITIDNAGLRMIFEYKDQDKDDAEAAAKAAADLAATQVVIQG